MQKKNTTQHVTFYTFGYFYVGKTLHCISAVLTCLQIPQVFAAHLIVPSFAVPITSTPDIKSVVNSNSAMSCSCTWYVVLQSVHQNSLP